MRGRRRRKRKANDPRRDKTTAATAWSQNLSKTLHTLFHCTWEFPWYPINPTAKVAPFPENSRATMAASTIFTSALSPLFPIATTRDTAAHTLAIAFTTTKNLVHSNCTCHTCSFITNYFIPSYFNSFREELSDGFHSITKCEI